METMRLYKLKFEERFKPLTPMQDTNFVEAQKKIFESRNSTYLSATGNVLSDNVSLLVLVVAQQKTFVTPQGRIGDSM